MAEDRDGERARWKLLRARLSMAAAGEVVVSCEEEEEREEEKVGRLHLAGSLGRTTGRLGGVVACLGVAQCVLGGINRRLCFLLCLRRRTMEMEHIKRVSANFSKHVHGQTSDVSKREGRGNDWPYGNYYDPKGIGGQHSGVSRCVAPHIGLKPMWKIAREESCGLQLQHA